MRENQSVERKRPQVFLSYSSADKEVARRIVDKLRSEGANVSYDAYELKSGDSISQNMDRAISASDFLIVLLSPNSVDSHWVTRELDAAYAQELTTRDVTVLPIMIEDCRIPPLLADRQYLDLRLNFEKGLDQLVEEMGLAPSIDFSRLDEQSFEELVADLLRVLGFTAIEQESRLGDRRIDIKATYDRKDPFGTERRETWIVEVKFYRKERADLRSISQLAMFLSTLPERVKGLIVTNSEITSTAREWLDSKQRQSRVEVWILDGTDLKRLLLRHKDLIYKHIVGSK